MKKMTIILGIIFTVLSIAAGVFLVVPGFSDLIFFKDLLEGTLNAIVALFTFQLLQVIPMVMFGGMVLVVCLFLAMIIVGICKKRAAISVLSIPFLIWEAVAILGLFYVIVVNPIFLETGVSTTATWSQFVTFGVALAAVLSGLCFSIVTMLLESKAKLLASKKPVDIIAQATSVPEPVDEEKKEETEEEPKVEEEEKQEEPKPEEEKPQEEEEEEEIIAQIHEVEEKVESPLDDENEPKVEPLEEQKEEPKPEEEEQKEEPKVEEPKEEEKPEEEVSEEPKEEYKTDKVYHVSKRKGDGKWTIKFAKGTKVIKTFNTKVEAVKYAYELADRQNARVAIHASKGQYKGKIRSVE